MVPVIDISGFDDPARKQTIAKQVAAACRDIGFLTIVGHGVPQTLIARVRQVSNEFFALDLPEKLSAQRTNADHNRGYFPFGEVALAKSIGKQTPPDRKEVFSIGRDLVRTMPDADAAAAIHFAPNYWPANFPRMQPVLDEYFSALLRLSGRLMEIFALSLNLPQHYFDSFIDRSPSTLALVNYFHTQDAASQGQLRAGEHTDYGTLTILLSENKPGGLQVRTRAGQWIDAKTVDNSFVINIGDLMQRWTNDTFLSNMHRVANPPPDTQGSTQRLSIVFFHNANHDALIECIPTCLDEGIAKYSPIVAGEHRLEKYRRANQLSKTA